MAGKTRKKGLSSANPEISTWGHKHGEVAVQMRMLVHISARTASVISMLMTKVNDIGGEGDGFCEAQ